MNKQALYRLKEKVKNKFPSLQKTSFKIWGNGKSYFQCYIVNNDEPEFYGHIYRIENLEKGILSIIE